MTLTSMPAPASPPWNPDAGLDTFLACLRADGTTDLERAVTAAQITRAFSRLPRGIRGTATARARAANPALYDDDPQGLCETRQGERIREGDPVLIMTPVNGHQGYGRATRLLPRADPPSLVVTDPRGRRIAVNTANVAPDTWTTAADGQPCP